jgi:hypothetical protein
MLALCLYHKTAGQVGFLSIWDQFALDIPPKRYQASEVTSEHFYIIAILNISLV